MKFSIIKHNKNGQYDGRPVFDGYMNDHWIKPLTNTFTLVENHDEADFTILPIVWERDYEYDESLNFKNFKNIIILDFYEYGCGAWVHKSYDTSYNLFGFNHFLNFDETFFERDQEIQKLHNGIFNHLQQSVRVYFKRELSSLLDYSSMGVKVLPADFINDIPIFDPKSEDDFWKEKTIDLLYIWGRSSTCRARLHGALWQEIDVFGHNFFDSLDQYEFEHVNDKRERSIVLLHREHYERVPYMDFQFKAKCVIDMYGAGKKCFRTIESSIDTISIKQDPSAQAHRYPWVDGENCITIPNEEDTNKLDVSKSVEKIISYIRRGQQHELYNIYVNSVATSHKYNQDIYMKDYVIPEIQNSLK